MQGLGIFWALFGALIGISAAQRKGFSLVGGVIGGLLLGPLAFLMFLCSGGRKKCPFCSEWIKKEAIVCRYCHKDINQNPCATPQFFQDARNRAPDGLTSETERINRFSKAVVTVEELFQKRQLDSCGQKLMALLDQKEQSEHIVDPVNAQKMQDLVAELDMLYIDFQHADTHFRKLLKQAQLKLTQSEFSDCLELCRELKECNIEDSSCENIASAVQEKLSDFKQLEQNAKLSFAVKNYRDAEKFCQGILLQYPGHAPTLKMLDECWYWQKQQHRRRMISLWLLTATIVCLCCLAGAFMLIQQQKRTASVAAVLREHIDKAIVAQTRNDWEQVLSILDFSMPQEPSKRAYEKKPLLGLREKIAALQNEAREHLYAAQVAVVAALLRECLAAASAAKDRGDWDAALATLAAEPPKEPFPGAFQEEPLKQLLAQLASLKNAAEAGKRSAAIETHLAAARAAAGKNDWAMVLAACEKTLALDAGNDEAKTLRAEAGKRHLRAPEGFSPAPGTGPEPYTATGWAAAVIHEKSGIELVYIPAGTFTMGSPATKANRGGGESQHQVTLSQGFYLGKTEVTQAQWEKVTGQNPSYFKNAGADAPVENVSWYDSQAFCQAAGSGLRLPLEAEWEYACRAGTTTAFHYGDSLDSSMANFDGNYPHGEGKKGEYRKTTIAVGQFKPNALGLYDMHGNVWEWCQDKYEAYPAGPVTLAQPVGPAGREKGDGAGRVLRGGSWYLNARGCRTAYRNGSKPDNRDGDGGVRVARSAPPVQ